MDLPEDLEKLVSEIDKKRTQSILNNIAASEVNSMEEFVENWQLSQFWYKKSTCDYLTQRAIHLTNAGDSIALISCPSIYISLRDTKCGRELKLLEFDERFKLFGNDYLYYDYVHPLRIPKFLKHTFDLVILDPPFLSEECLLKSVITAKFLSKQKVILCTGSVMEPFAKQYLSAYRTTFKPQHEKLCNDFACYVNFPTELFDDSKVYHFVDKS